jgi:hypothetical protein
MACKIHEEVRSPPPTTQEFQPPHHLKPKTLSQKLEKEPNLEGPSTPKLIERKPSCKHPFHLLLPPIDSFVIEHILTHLPMDPLMMWHLR